MKIKFLQGISGPEWSFAPNDVVDVVNMAEAKRLIEAGIAAPEKKRPATATIKAAESR